MLQTTQRFIEEYIDDIELNKWENIHKTLEETSGLNVHIDFIKTMLEAGLTSVTPEYSLEQLNKDLDIIDKIEFKDFSEPIKERDNLYLYLKNDQIAIAISNILKATHYFDKYDFIDTADKDVQHNLYIRLADIYDKAGTNGYLQGKVESWVSVNLDTRVTNLVNDKGPMHFDFNKDNITGQIQFPVNALFESNVYRAIAYWLAYYIFAD